MFHEDVLIGFAASETVTRLADRDITAARAQVKTASSQGIRSVVPGSLCSSDRSHVCSPRDGTFYAFGLVGHTCRMSYSMSIAYCERYTGAFCGRSIAYAGYSSSTHRSITT